MSDHQNSDIRNLAIIAHVDHGKTTLVDALLKQGQVFRAHQQVGTLIMDTNELERERGITILAKNASVSYEGIRINIIDTPGHADFGGEVERVMNMADGCLLLVDAVDGPMPQTTYVLRQALKQNVTPMVVINKIDRPEARAAEVVDMVQDLFLEVATNAEQLDFPVLYASARDGYATTSLNDPGLDMQPLFEAILNSVPSADRGQKRPAANACCGARLRQLSRASCCRTDYQRHTQTARSRSPVGMQHRAHLPSCGAHIRVSWNGAG